MSKMRSDKKSVIFETTQFAIKKEAKKHTWERNHWKRCGSSVQAWSKGPPPSFHVLQVVIQMERSKLSRSLSNSCVKTE